MSDPSDSNNLPQSNSPPPPNNIPPPLLPDFSKLLSQKLNNIDREPKEESANPDSDDLLHLNRRSFHYSLSEDESVYRPGRYLSASADMIDSFQRLTAGIRIKHSGRSNTMFYAYRMVQIHQFCTRKDQKKKFRVCSILG